MDYNNSSRRFRPWGSGVMALSKKHNYPLSPRFSARLLPLWRGRSVHIRTYARAYSWNLENIYFSFPESIFIIKLGWLINLSHYMLVSLPVWRVDISPFACNLLDSVAVLPFSSKHYTLPIIAFPFVFIYWNVLRKTPLKLKHFLRSMSPYLVCSTPLRRFSLSLRAYTFKTSRYAPVWTELCHLSIHY